MRFICFACKAVRTRTPSSFTPRLDGVEKGLAELERGRGGDGDGFAGSVIAQPWRAARLLVVKVPNPAMVTVSRSASASRTVENMALAALSAAALESGV